jgi:hypothetical protein
MLRPQAVINRTVLKGSHMHDSSACSHFMCCQVLTEAVALLPGFYADKQRRQFAQRLLLDEMEILFTLWHEQCLLLAAIQRTADNTFVRIPIKSRF